jgi:hypothetical protein
MNSHLQLHRQEVKAKAEFSPAGALKACPRYSEFPGKDREVCSKTFRNIFIYYLLYTKLRNQWPHMTTNTDFIALVQESH